RRAGARLRVGARLINDLRVLGAAEAQEVERDGRWMVVADGRGDTTPGEEERPATLHAPPAGGRALRVLVLALLVVVWPVPVCGPLAHIPEHVVEPVWVWLLGRHRPRPRDRLLGIPGVVLERFRVPCRQPALRGLFPLGLGGQAFGRRLLPAV